VVHHVVRRMVMPNLLHLHAEQVTANLNHHHAEQVTVNQLLPVVQVKVTQNLRPQPVVPHAEPAESKNLMFPAMQSDRELI
jgi:hypothetical protein